MLGARLVLILVHLIDQVVHGGYLPNAVRHARKHNSQRDQRNKLDEAGNQFPDDAEADEKQHHRAKDDDPARKRAYISADIVNIDGRARRQYFDRKQHDQQYEQEFLHELIIPKQERTVKMKKQRVVRNAGQDFHRALAVCCTRR